MMKFLTVILIVALCNVVSNATLHDLIIITIVEFPENDEWSLEDDHRYLHNNNYKRIDTTSTYIIDEIQFLEKINRNRLNTIIFSDFHENIKNENLLKYKKIQKEKGMKIYMLNWAKSMIERPLDMIHMLLKIISNSLAEFFVNCDNLDEMHIVGLGMGAHLAGFVGRAIQTQSNNTKIVGRITGLDPTYGGSYHILYLIRDPLNEHDAEFVDIIHTSYQYSPDLATGTVNFWPNNFNHSVETVELGTNRYGYPNYVVTTYAQPGCTIDDLKCCHKIAIDYWLESLNNENAFPAVPANEFYNKQTEDSYLLYGLLTNYMGYYARNLYLTKNYYLRTSKDVSNYSLGSAGIYFNEAI